MLTAASRAQVAQVFVVVPVGMVVPGGLIEPIVKLLQPALPEMNFTPQEAYAAEKPKTANKDPRDHKDTDDTEAAFCPCCLLGPCFGFLIGKDEAGETGASEAWISSYFKRSAYLPAFCSW